jgi:hypothetical protein
MMMLGYVVLTQAVTVWFIRCGRSAFKRQTWPAAAQVRHCRPILAETRRPHIDC